jgi:hypothetical protein
MYYFSYFCMYPEEPKGKVRLSKHPLKTDQGPFGYIKDLDGNDWDANGYMGGCILLRPVVLGYDPWYGSCSNFIPHGERKWLPYEIEVVEKENNDGVAE